MRAKVNIKFNDGQAVQSPALLELIDGRLVLHSLGITFQPEEVKEFTVKTIPDSKPEYVGTKFGVNPRMFNPIYVESLAEAVRQLVTDVEAVGLDKVKQDWPDLFITYEIAKATLDNTTDGATGEVKL